LAARAANIYTALEDAPRDKACFASDVLLGPFAQQPITYVRSYATNNRHCFGAVPGGGAIKRPIAQRIRCGAPLQHNLRVGARGNDVRELQRRLKALGYDLGRSGSRRDGVDGQFGPKTKGAVLAFQKQHKLHPATGNVGERTRAALNRVCR